MRIAYVCYWDLFTRDGVAGKIVDQAARWRGSGHEVSVFCLSHPPPEGENGGTEADLFLFRSLLQRIRSTRRLANAVEQFAPDVVYLRFDLFIPPLTRILRRFRTVVEVNSDDLQELEQRGRLVSAYNRFQRRLLLTNTAGAAFVTRELAESPSFALVRGERCVISNGIELPDTAIAPPPRNERLRLVFLGASTYWQGVDKLLWLAEQSPELEFDLAGPGLAPGSLPANVTWHGHLGQVEYERLLADADVGVGTLALHRKAMNEACALKVRTYLAHGLPVLLGHEDSDFRGTSPWFLLQLPNTEENVREHLDGIRKFVQEMRGKRVPHDLVRNSIAAEAKERERLLFLQDVVGAAGLGR